MIQTKQQKESFNTLTRNSETLFLNPQIKKLERKEMYDSKKKGGAHFSSVPVYSYIKLCVKTLNYV